MKKLLVVIDMQVDFITGSLGTGEAIRIVPAVRNKIEHALAGNVSVVFTKDTHSDTYLNTQEGKNLPVAHCIEHTPGWELCEELFPFEKNGLPVFCKPTFGSLSLAQYIRENEFTDVELVGLCTDICVISNALLIKAHMPEALISVDVSCCAGVTPQSHRNALEAMKICQIQIKE